MIRVVANFIRYVAIVLNMPFSLLILITVPVNKKNAAAPRFSEKSRWPNNSHRNKGQKKFTFTTMTVKLCWGVFRPKLFWSVHMGVCLYGSVHLG